MAVCAANMEKCDPKRKCLFGPNEGEAYNPNDPCCGMGEFDSSTCDCILQTGWVYVRQVSTGFCYQFASGTETTICPDSFVTATGRLYYGNYAQGDPIPTLAWETSLAWEVGQETSGMISLGANITAELESGTQTTSDNTPWDIPQTLAAVTGDSSSCTQPFSNCGAVRLGDQVAESVLYFDLLPYPEDKEAYCSGLSDEECFYLAYDDYGPSS